MDWKQPVEHMNTGTPQSAASTATTNGPLPSAIKRGMRVSVVEGVFAQFHITLTGGMFLAAYALYLNASAFQIGVLASIPSILAGVGFFSAYLANLMGSRRALCVLSSGLGRGCFAIFVVALLLDTRLSITAFFGVIFLFNLLLNFSSNIWMSWMSDLVPRHLRGRYFGVRSTVVSAVGMIVNYAGGRVLDAFPPDQAFVTIFSAAVLCSTIAALILTGQHEPAFERKVIRLRHVFTTPLRDRNFLALVAFVSVWYLLSGIASPFYVVHMIQNLRMTYAQIAIYSIIAGVMGLGFQVIWGKMIDRVKSKPVLVINFAGVVMLPLIWLFARPTFILPIWIDAFLTGILWSGVNLSLFNILLSLTEDKDLKESYFAVFSTITGLCGFFASLLGGVVAQALRGFRFEFLGQVFVNFHLLFIASSLFRLASVFLLRRVRERGAQTAVQALHLMGDYTVRRLNQNKDLILNTLRFTR